MVKLESLKTLSQVESIKDVKPLAKTVFPGAHCPLFGSALILKGVTDALMIVIGTDECTYYTCWDFSNQRATYWRYARYVYSFRLIHQFRDLFPVVIRLSSEVADTGIVGHRIFIDCCGYLIFYQRL